MFSSLTLFSFHYGDPEWYRKYVIPVRTLRPSPGRASHDRRFDLVAYYQGQLFPSDDRTARSSSMPTNHAAVRQEIGPIKAERDALRAQREHGATEEPLPNEGVKKLV